MICRRIAQACIVYGTACLIYLVAARFLQTPLRDSYTGYQHMLRRRSAKERRRLFLFSLVAAAVMVHVGGYCSRCA